MRKKRRNNGPSFWDLGKLGVRAAELFEKHKRHKAIEIIKEANVHYFRNTNTGKKTAIYDSFVMSVDDPCLGIVAHLLEVPIEDLISSLEASSNEDTSRRTDTPQQVPATPVPSPDHRRDRKQRI